MVAAHGLAALVQIQHYSLKDQLQKSQHTVEEALVSEQALLLISKPRKESNRGRKDDKSR